MMLDGLRKLLKSTVAAGSDAAGKPRDDVELATAALLVEMARADFTEEPAEFEVIARLLEERFAMTAEEIEALVRRAKSRADHAVSLHEFTRLLHEQLDAEEKLAMVEMLWRLSLADGRIDKHEEHLVKKVAGLLYVPDREMIATKLRVMDALSTGGGQRQ
jgi:uncharacterized tellurite resistance protein B-like protein